MRSLRLIVSYDGTDFFGWQWQPGMRTVQQCLEEAIALVTGETTRVVAAGRTDTGVHAYGQAVSWDTESRLETGVLLRALNANLPPDMAVRAVEEAPPGFNSITDSRGKRYRYLIHDRRIRDVFVRRYAWQVWQTLDNAAMQEAARGLCGTHDFIAFQNAGSPRVHTVRTVRDLSVIRTREWGENCVSVEIEADGFLYNMVRNIVGTLVEVGKGKQPIDWPARVLAGRDRTTGGMCAPPQGLYLLQVYYSF